MLQHRKIDYSSLLMKQKPLLTSQHRSKLKLVTMLFCVTCFYVALLKTNGPIRARMIYNERIFQLNYLQLTPLRTDNLPVISKVLYAANNSHHVQNRYFAKDFSLQFNINNPYVCKGDKVDVIICVHTQPSNNKLRQAIRQTWTNQKHWLNYRVKTLFFIGLTSADKSLQAALEMESDAFKDIIQADFEDTYRNLTLKALSVLHWVHNYCPNSTYVFKVDDDVIVNIFALQELMSSMSTKEMTKSSSLDRPQYLIACNTFQNITVKRAGKWAVKEEELPTEVKMYPQFCAGMGYLMHTYTALALHDVADQEPFFWIDDIYVTGFLANRIKATYFPINLGVIWSEKYVVKRLLGKKWKMHYLAHTKNVKMMLLSWNRIMTLSQLN